MQDSTYNFTSKICKLDTLPIPDTIKTNMHACLAKDMENLWQFLKFGISGGGGGRSSIEESLFKISAQRTGTYQRGGLNRTFTVNADKILDKQPKFSSFGLVS